MAPKGPPGTSAGSGMEEPCQGLRKPKRKGSMWLTRCLFPFAGRRGRSHSDTGPPPSHGADGLEKACSSDASPSTAITLHGAAVKQAFVVDASPAARAELAAIGAEASADARPKLLAIEAPAAASAAPPVAGLRATAAAPAQLQLQLSLQLAAARNSPEGQTVGKCLAPLPPLDMTARPREEDRGPIAGIAPAAGMRITGIGSAAGVPAADLPSWWAGKEPVPMELLEEEDGAANVEADTLLLPPLPRSTPATPCLQAHKLAAPCENSPEGALHGTEEPKAPILSPVLSPEIRPRSFRLKANRSLPEGRKDEGCGQGSSPVPKTDKGSPPQKTEKGGRSSSSMSSRPTTAGAESASTYSTSWREEWTPGMNAEKPAGLLLMPPTSGLNAKKPPLPPLPMRPPESGSVLSSLATGAASGFQTTPTAKSAGPTLGSSGSWEAPRGLEAPRLPSPQARLPSPPAIGAGSGTPVDDVALRRISQGWTAKAATPPPFARRKSNESSADASSAPASAVLEQEAASDVEGGAPTDVAAASDTKEAQVREESVRGQFSELSRAFTDGIM